MWRDSTRRRLEAARTSSERRTRWWTHTLLLSLLVLVVGVTTLLASVQSSPSPLGASTAWASELSDARAELEKARAALKAKQAELDKLAVRHEEALARLEMTQDRIAEVQAELERSNSDLDQMQSQLQDRVRRAYMNRGTESAAVLETLFAAGVDFSTVINRLTSLTRLVKQDQEVFAQVERHIGKLSGLRAELDRTQAEQDDLVAQLEADNAHALEVLEAAAAEYNALKKRVATLEEEERKRKEAEAKAAAEAAAKAKSNSSGSSGSGSSGGSSGSGSSGGGQTYTKVVEGDWCFPVDGPNSFTDTWGAPRSGGRTHKGTDIMCARNTPLLAVVSGTIWHTTPYEEGAGGIGLWIAGNDNNYYYYCHLESIAPGIKPGVSVTMGQVVGYAGDSGNARGGSVHLHFEIHPGNGPAINPYPTLAAHR